MKYKPGKYTPRPSRVEDGILIIDDYLLEMDDLYYNYYKDELFTGRSEIYYRNGMLRHISEYEEGIPHGVERSWHRNGQLKKELFFVKGCARGWKKKWYPNGRLQIEQLIGECGYGLQGKEYDEQGNLLREWDESGKLIYGEPSTIRPGSVEYLLKEGEKELKLYQEKMIQAIRKGDLEMVKDIVYRDVPPDFKDDQGKTPLEWALESGNQQMIRFLWEEVKPTKESWIAKIWKKGFSI